MAMVKKSITVTDQQNSWIRAQIESGLFGNESEVVRELIRERQYIEQADTSEIEMIRAELIKAEQSGFTELNPKEILREIKNGLGRDGGLQAKRRG